MILHLPSLTPTLILLVISCIGIIYNARYNHSSYITVRYATTCSLIRFQITSVKNLQENVEYEPARREDDVPRTFSFNDYDAAGDMKNTKNCFGDSDKDKPITNLTYLTTPEDGDSGDGGDSIPRGFFDD